MLLQFSPQREEMQRFGEQVIAPYVQRPEPVVLEGHGVRPRRSLSRSSSKGTASGWSR
jgi:hypothetical protein